MTAEIWYTATRRFTPDARPDWPDYVRWSRLHHLERVVSLDVSLCPSAIGSLTAEDWQHNVSDDFRIHYFRDLDYLLRRMGDQQDRLNLLALALEPTQEAAAALADSRFRWCGHDLVERETGISALTNCGGFDLAFTARDMSTDGLIVAYARARDVQSALRRHYPGEHHANCELWAIWELVDW